MSLVWVFVAIAAVVVVSALVYFIGSALPKPESTEGRPWGQPLKKLEGAPVNLG